MFDFFHNFWTIYDEKLSIFIKIIFWQLSATGNYNIACTQDPATWSLLSIGSHGQSLPNYIIYISLGVNHDKITDKITK